jgi:putative ABC transport system permease protein
MFNSNTLFRILVEANSRATPSKPAKAQVADIIKLRHEGEEDVTVITQDAVLATFRQAARCADSGRGRHCRHQPGGGRHSGDERDAGVGQPAHCRDRPAQSARRHRHGIRMAFLTEARCSRWPVRWWAIGLGQLAAAVIRQLYPVHFPAYPPDWAVIAGLATALVTGILFGVLPARRAAQLDPVQALSKR